MLDAKVVVLDSPTTSERMAQNVVHVTAVKHLGQFDGESQPQVMLDEQGNAYLVKFQNNPQGKRILANELLGGNLARLLGLPVPPAAIVHVSEETILTEGLCFKLPRGNQRCHAGTCFGSLCRLDTSSLLGMPPKTIVNRSDILGMLVFDKWTGNADHRQVIVVSNHSRFRRWLMMVDQGLCFGGRDWGFHDGALQGFGRFREMYRHAVGLEDFEPWLTRLEQTIDLETLRTASETIPPEWYDHDRNALERLLRQLSQRQTIVRGLLRSSLHCLPHIFPNVLSEQRSESKRHGGIDRF